MATQVGVMNNETTSGIWLEIFHNYIDLQTNFKDPNSLGYKMWTRSFGVFEFDSRVANLKRPAVGNLPVKVGMVVNPSIHCGIREHTSYFSKHIKTPCVSISQDPKSSQFDEVIQQCKTLGITILHIQHEFSLFLDRAGFGKCLDNLNSLGIRVVLDFHTGQVEETDIAQMKTWVDKVAKVVVHTDSVYQQFASEKTVQIPLAIEDDCLWAPEADSLIDIPPDKLKTTVTIGSIGFHNEHKGFYQLAQSMGLVRRRYPDANLLIIGSHTFPWQDLSFKKVHRVCVQFPSLLLDRFMGIPEVVRTLAICDLVVLPYRIHSKSQSGAVETALLSGRPVMLSESWMFNHIPNEHIVGRLPIDATPKDIGEKVRDTVIQQPDCVKAARTRLASRRGSKLAQLYDKIYQEVTTK